MPDPRSRFSSRVENYIKFRPGYPAAVIKLLERECGLTQHSVIADIGSGTGILSELFLKHGNKVFCVEPNAEMRLAAERLLNQFGNFASVGAAAEDTGLLANSVDFVVAGQAFHWFDPQKARAEFQRILKPDGWVVLIWNERRLDSTAFLRAYEQLILRWGTDYEKVRHENTTKNINEFFAPEPFKVSKLDNIQVFDLAGLEGRVFSASYTPEPGNPNFEPMLRALRELFAEHATNGTVAFEYDTALYYGQVSTTSR
jgi:SAM-dependent methyltransferase